MSFSFIPGGSISCLSNPYRGEGYWRLPPGCLAHHRPGSWTELRTSDCLGRISRAPSFCQDTYLSECVKKGVQNTMNVNPAVRITTAHDGMRHQVKSNRA